MVSWVFVAVAFGYSRMCWAGRVWVVMWKWWDDILRSVKPYVLGGGRKTKKKWKGFWSDAVNGIKDIYFMLHPGQWNTLSKVSASLKCQACQEISLETQSVLACLTNQSRKEQWSRKWCNVTGHNIAVWSSYLCLTYDPCSYFDCLEMSWPNLMIPNRLSCFWRHREERRPYKGLSWRTRQGDLREMCSQRG